MTRRTFLETTALAGASALAGGCCCTCCKTARYGKIALQLYSLGAYTDKVGFEKTLADVRKIGFEGVEFAGYHGWDAKKLKEQLAANGLVVCGTHVPNSKFGFDTKKWTFDPEVMKKTCEFELSYGNNLIICPGEVKLLDGTSFWDYFFSNTSKDVCMEQDVGWSTCAGVDCCEQYKKYPGRSPTLHAKENGMAKEVKEFDAILGQPGKPGAVPVPWDKLFVASDADKVEWYVVECERHFDDPNAAVVPSYNFLKAKGRC